MTKVDLQRVLDLDAKATDGPWEHVESTLTREQHYVLVEGIGPVVGDTEPEDAALIACYRTAAPAMAAALKAVLELHQPVEVEPSETICAECSFRLPNGRYFGKIVEYPCPTVQAIHDHLGEPS